MLDYLSAIAQTPNIPSYSSSTGGATTIFFDLLNTEAKKDFTLLKNAVMGWV